MRRLLRKYLIEKIACKPEEKRLEVSVRFWYVYEEIKNIRDMRSLPVSERSLEQQAINNLKTFLKVSSASLLIDSGTMMLPIAKDFLKILLEDILDYGTLPDYTLRHIANFESSDPNKIANAIKEINTITEELGEDYLEQEKLRQRNLVKEIVVAIENQKL